MDRPATSNKDNYYHKTSGNPATTRTTRIGVGRHTLPAGVPEWPEFLKHPPTNPFSSADRAKVWSTGVKTGGQKDYFIPHSVVTKPDAPKYVPGAGGVAGHIGLGK